MLVRTAGETVAVTSQLPWVTRLVATHVGADGMDEPGAGVPTVVLSVEASTAPFRSTGMRVVTRGAYAEGGRVLLRDAGGSGFDLWCEAGSGTLAVTARYRPRPVVRAANLALSGRFGLLAAQVLVHYPALWRAGWRGRVPLHASVLSTASGTPLLAGPGGVGKTRILSAALRDGATAIADNLCCADATTCFGVVEPLRTDATRGRWPRTPHGRTSRPFGARAPMLTPDRVVVVERGTTTSVRPVPPEEAARALVAGTYAAGELRRYWAFAATLALATGRGPAHPPVGEIAAGYTARLPCLRVRVGDGETLSTGQLCGADADEVVSR
ncbi:MAG TPA: hypothetical protein VKB69_13660 [Micromonosporaceae bacterium]|nr:hypothetical protein [Micromonosporaceae bacterium]